MTVDSITGEFIIKYYIFYIYSSTIISSINLNPPLIFLEVWWKLWFYEQMVMYLYIIHIIPINIYEYVVYIFSANK